MQVETSGGRAELITFRVAEQDFCVDIQSVLEIRGWSPVTPLPRAPDHVLGTINLRGQVLPIIELAAALGLPRTTPDSRHAIIVARIAGRLTGLLVEGVSEILTIDRSEVQPAPDLGAAACARFVSGLIASGSSMLTLLSIDRLFENDTLAA